MVSKNDVRMSSLLKGGKKALNFFLHEQAKAALIKHLISCIKDIDAPHAFYFNLSRTTKLQNQMAYLTCADGTLPTEPSEIRRAITDFYRQLYSAEPYLDLSCRDKLLRELPKFLDAEVTELQEVTDAVQ